MSRYIDAEKINLNYLPLTALGGQMFAYEKDIDETPKEDVALVIHGHWVGEADGYADGELVYDMWYCSHCGYRVDGDEEPWYKFCPNCGANMNGDKE